jgi:hypothetical protein
MPPIQDAPIEPEVAREMTIEPLVLPPRFEPRIKEADLVDFDKRDQRILLDLSVLEQQNTWLVQAALQWNRDMRRIEAELIRQRLAQAALKWQAGIGRWIVITLGAGTAGAGLTQLFRLVWP